MSFKLALSASLSDLFCLDRSTSILSLFPFLRTITINSFIGPPYDSLIELLSEMGSTALESITLEVTFASGGGDDLATGAHHLSELDDFFGDHTPRNPAQAASLRIICYDVQETTSRQYFPNHPVTFIDVQTLIYNAFPLMYPLGRLIVDIRKENTALWFP